MTFRTPETAYRLQVLKVLEDRYELGKQHVVKLSAHGAGADLWFTVVFDDGSAFQGSARAGTWSLAKVPDCEQPPRPRGYRACSTGPLAVEQKRPEERDDRAPAAPQAFVTEAGVVGLPGFVVDHLGVVEGDSVYLAIRPQGVVGITSTPRDDATAMKLVRARDERLALGLSLFFREHLGVDGGGGVVFFTEPGDAVRLMNNETALREMYGPEDEE